MWHVLKFESMLHMPENLRTEVKKKDPRESMFQLKRRHFFEYMK